MGLAQNPLYALDGTVAWCTGLIVDSQNWHASMYLHHRKFEALAIATRAECISIIEVLSVFTSVYAALTSSSFHTVCCPALDMARGALLLRFKEMAECIMRGCMAVRRNRNNVGKQIVETRDW